MTDVGKIAMGVLIGVCVSIGGIYLDEKFPSVGDVKTMEKPAPAEKFFPINPEKVCSWPSDVPVPPPDQYLEFTSMNGFPCKKVEGPPGVWHWELDKEAMELQQKYEQHRRDMYWALRSRILTDDEMREVMSYGDGLVIEPNTPYHAAEKAKELNEALLQQYRLRLALPVKP